MQDVINMFIKFKITANDYTKNCNVALASYIDSRLRAYKIPLL